MYKMNDEEYLDVYNNIKHIAMKHYSKNKEICELNDLISEGFIALQKKLKKYDPSKNDRIMGFCYTRVNGAMLDYIGKIHPMGYYAVRKKTLAKIQEKYYKKYGKAYQHKQLNNTSSFRQYYTDSVMLELISPEDVAILHDYMNKFKLSCQLVFDDLVYEGFLLEQYFTTFYAVMEDIILENENIRTQLNILNQVSIKKISMQVLTSAVNDVSEVLKKEHSLKHSKRKFKESW